MTMKEKLITRDEAFVLSCREEGHFFDRKDAAISGQKLQKVVVAFANADGGEVIVGVSDDSHQPDPEKRWVGLPSMESYNGLLQAIYSLNPSVDIHYEFLRIDGDTNIVLHMFIDRTAEVHQTSDGKVYQRYGAQSLPLTSHQITELGFAKGATSYEDMPLANAEPEVIVDSLEIRRFLSAYSPTTDPLDYLVNQHLLIRKTFSPIVAGILLYADSPSAILPRKCGVRISRYETREEDPEREHLKESYYVEGPAYQLIYDAVGRITEILSDLASDMTTSAGHKGYPPEAIWEVFVNAIIHRDYSISDDVHVTIFNDRVEIASPGRFPGYVRADNILDARYSRNSKLVRCLNRYPNPPNKDMGEGLNTVFQKMMDWKLKPPVIVEDKNYIKVIIKHEPLALPIEAIMEFLEKNDSITNAQARELTGIKSENAVKREFYKLRDKGLIEQDPEKKGRHSAWRKPLR